MGQEAGGLPEAVGLGFLFDVEVALDSFEAVSYIREV